MFLRGAIFCRRWYRLELKTGKKGGSKKRVPRQTGQDVGESNFRVHKVALAQLNVDTVFMKKLDAKSMRKHVP